MIKSLVLLFLCLLLAPRSGFSAQKRLKSRGPGAPVVSTRQQTAERCRKYRKLVYQSAQRYRLDPRLILAIIEVESNFNPKAVGFQHGFGLMQVVPSTAGRDVFARLKKRSGQPSRRQLFDPRYNIDMGAAYLHLLQTVYLAKINHPRTRHYAMIAAYNGGQGNLFKLFAHHPKQSIQAINQLTPAGFYQRVSQRHPLATTRAYLAKVTHAHSKY